MCFKEGLIMKRLLTLSALLLFSVDAFAEEDSKVCEVQMLGKNEITQGFSKDIEKCKMGDVLVVYSGNKSKRNFVSRTVARICKPETISIPFTATPKVYICVYSGEVLEVVRSPNAN